MKEAEKKSTLKGKRQIATYHIQKRLFKTGKRERERETGREIGREKGEESARARERESSRERERVRERERESINQISNRAAFRKKATLPFHY